MNLCSTGLILLCLIPALAATARAEIDHPLQQFEQVDSKAEETEVVRVKTAKVIIADYDLLRRDFPELRKFGAGETSKIDEWIVSHAGYVATSQTKPNGVNTPIETLVSQAPKTIRPFGYGRGLVFSTGAGMPLLDGKGFGADQPTQKNHANGLGTTGEMAREFVMEKIVQTTMRASGSDFRTVGSYAVIDWGFDVIHADGSHSPAGAVLRQAHSRVWVKDQNNTLTNTFIEDEKAGRVERILRHYGMTSAGDTWNSKVQRVNIQSSSKGALIDFGAYLVVPSFEKPVFPYTLNEPGHPSAEFNWVNSVLHPNDPSWTQPDSKVRIPYVEWGGADPKMDGIWNKSHAWVEAFRHSKIDATELRARLALELARMNKIVSSEKGVLPFAKQDPTRPLTPIEKFSAVDASNISAEKKLRLLSSMKKIPDSEIPWLVSTFYVQNKLPLEVVHALVKTESPKGPRMLMEVLEHSGFLKEFSHDDWTTGALTALSDVPDHGARYDRLLLAALKSNEGFSAARKREVFRILYWRLDGGQPFDLEFRTIARAILSKKGELSSEAFKFLMSTETKIDAEFFRGPIRQVLETDPHHAWGILNKLDKSIDRVSRDPETARVFEQFLQGVEKLDPDWPTDFKRIAGLFKQWSTAGCLSKVFQNLQSASK